jgi:hypothetical protein
MSISDGIGEIVCMYGREVNVWIVEDSEPAKRAVELVRKRSFLMSTWITPLRLLKTFGRCMMLQMADYLFRDRNVVVAEGGGEYRGFLSR